jgi:hypothetical protein
VVLIGCGRGTFAGFGLTDRTDGKRHEDDATLRRHHPGTFGLAGLASSARFAITSYNAVESLRLATTVSSLTPEIPAARIRSRRPVQAPL